MDSVSAYLSDPKKSLRLQQELDQAFIVQTEINQACDKARRLLIKGNHEDRMRKALLRHLPGLTHLKALSIDAILRLSELGIEYVEESIGLGSVEMIHGWTAKKWAGNSVRSAIEQMGATQSVIQGHAHRGAIITRGRGPAGPIYGGEVPTLSDSRKMDYLAGPPDWTQGDVLMEWSDGKPSFELIVFHGVTKLTALWRGRLYRA